MPLIKKTWIIVKRVTQQRGLLIFLLSGFHCSTTCSFIAHYLFYPETTYAYLNQMVRNVIRLSGYYISFISLLRVLLAMLPRRYCLENQRQYSIAEQLGI